MRSVFYHIAPDVIDIEAVISEEERIIQSS
jgi:hypothetical protein